MSNVNNKIKIGLVEDHEVVRNAISKMLADIPEFELVFDAANGQDFLDQLKDNPIDIVLLDLEMPVLNGIETINELNKLESAVKVVMLTMHDDLEIAFELLSKGANAYLLKECSTKEMVKAIITVHEKGSYTNEFMNDAIINSVASERKTQNRMKQLNLDQRDLKILQLICDGCTGQQIADAVFTSKKNLDLIRTKLMKKFKVKTGNELIRLCIIHNIYTPRTNEEIELEKQDLLLTKKLRKQYRLKQNNF
jgi:two-component system response regulator DegU